jgi:hypothetical protein
MNIEVIKPGMAAIIAKNCGITRIAASDLLNQVFKARITGRRRIPIQGMGDVFSEIRKMTKSSDSSTGHSSDIPSEVEIELKIGAHTKIIKLGGLEGDPITPPPGVRRFTLEGDPKTPFPDEHIYFTLEGDPFVIPPSSPRPTGPTPSIKIATLRRTKS